MPEWPKPHSSAQGSSYLPGLVASNHCGISRPGTASCFKRNCGHEEAVDDVLGLEVDVDDLVDRHVHLVEERLVVGGAELAVGPGIGRPAS